MKNKKRPVEQILEDILIELKRKNQQPVFPTYPHPTPTQTHPINQQPHYHGSGILCYANPCVWC